MCRNIKTLYNFYPPATKGEIHEASLQFIKKVSGFQKPSSANEKSFNQAVSKIEPILSELFKSLKTTSKPKNRDAEAKKAHQRAIKRFGKAV